MPFINLNANAAQEPKPVPNAKYDLTISSCESVLSKSEKPMFKARINIDGHDDAPSILHHVMIPQTLEDVKGFQGLMFKRFCTAFGVKLSPDGFDTDKLALELIGARASDIEVRQKEYEGNISNEINLPRLADEAAASKGRGTPPKR